MSAVHRFTFDRTLEEIAREGARRALQKAIEDEVAEYVEAHKHDRDESNHRLVVRNGHKPPRTILSGVGPLEVNQPRVDDRRVDEHGGRSRFTSTILPRYLRDEGRRELRQQKSVPVLEKIKACPRLWRRHCG